MVLQGATQSVRNPETAVLEREHAAGIGREPPDFPVLQRHGKEPLAVALEQQVRRNHQRMEKQRGARNKEERRLPDTRRRDREILFLPPCSPFLLFSLRGGASAYLFADESST